MVVLLKRDMDGLLCDYINNIARVTSYCDALEKFSVPTFKDSNNWKQEFTDILVNAKSHAILWENSILPNLQATPQAIIDYDDLFETYYKMIINDLNILIGEEKDDTKKTLIENLTKLQNGVSTNIELVNSMYISLSSFKESIHADKEEIEQLIDDITKEDTELSDSILDLENALVGLQREVDKHSKWLTASEVSLGVSMAVGAVAISFAFAEGPLAMPLLVLFGICAVVGVGGTIGSITGIIYENEKISKKKDEISDKTVSLNNMKSDIATLAATNSQIKELLESCAKAEVAMANIKLVWANLEEDLENVIESLSPQSSTKMPYESIISNIEIARNNWSELIENVKIMAGIVISVEDAA